jgi:hypothetical protein
MHTMGNNVQSPPHRCFNMRNPFARALLLSLGVLVLGAMLLRSDNVDVRAAILQTAAQAKHAVSQTPLGSFHGMEELESVQGQDEKQQPTPMTPSPFPNSSQTMGCEYDLSKLQELQEKYDLEDRFEYTKRYVQISRQDTKRQSITKLDQKFNPDPVKVVDLAGESLPPADTCAEPLVVPVTKSPFPQTANASDFMFGVSTTYKRFTNPQTSPIKEWTYWLTDSKGHSNGGKLLLMLLDATDDELDDAYDKLSKVGIDVDVYQSDVATEMAVRYLALVPTLYNHPERKSKKWLVTCDDDTFFPSFNALAQKVEEYDHTQQMYIGTLSEDVNNIDRHGSQAFGGAGVFLSLPMAQLITENFDSCKTDD